MHGSPHAAVAHFSAMNMPLSDPLENLDADALRALLREREQQLAQKDRLIRHKDTTIAQLTHEIAILRRFRFGKKSEQLTGVQGSLLEEAVAADIAAIEEELHQLTDHPKKVAPREQPKRQALPWHRIGEAGIIDVI